MTVEEDLARAFGGDPNDRQKESEEKARLCIFLDLYRKRNPEILVALRAIHLGERESRWEAIKDWTKSFGLPGSAMMLHLALETLEYWEVLCEDIESWAPEELEWSFDLHLTFFEVRRELLSTGVLKSVPHKRRSFAFEPITFARRFEPEGWQRATTVDEAERKIRQEFNEKVVSSMREELKARLQAYRERWVGHDLAAGLVREFRKRKVLVRDLEMLAEYQAEERCSVRGLHKKFGLSLDGTRKALKRAREQIGLDASRMRRARGGRPRKVE